MPPASRRARAWVPAGLFSLALVVRMLSWATVFEPEGARFVGNDAYYHMRRVVYGLAHFPRWLDFDPYLAFPDGARPIWTPVFDWLATLVLLPVAALGGVPAAERGAALIPPLLGAGCVAATWAAARRAFDAPTAGWAGAILAVLAGHVWYSQVGFFDHHAAVALVAVVMLWAAIALLSGAPTRGASLRLSATQAVALLLWPGMLLHLALVELGVGLRAAYDAPGGARLLRERALGHTAALVVLAPIGLGQSWPQWGDYAPTVLSRFQPWLFGALALHAAACSALWRRRRTPAGGARVGSALALAFAALSVSALALPGWVDASGEAWRWLGKQEQFQSQVAESKGILEGPEGVSAGPLLRNLSGLGLLLPFAIAALAATARGAARGPRWLIGIWSAGLLLATLLQRRFGNSAAIGVAMVSAWALCALWRRMGARPHGRLLRAGVAATTLLLVAPTLRPHIEPLRDAIERGRGRPVGIGSYLQTKRLLSDAATWLRVHGGGGGDLTDVERVPAFGVMAPWHLGHRLLYESRLPVVASNFGDDVGGANFELHRRYLRSAEPQAVRRLDRVRARYVVAESLNSRARDALGPGTMIRRLEETPLRNLAHHRLRHATDVPDAASVRHYRVFERVAGCEVEGEAPPGATVLARLRVAAGRRAILVEHEVRADAAGRYRLHLAQASADGAGTGWLVQAGERRAGVDVPLDAVLGGGTMVGPDLR